MSFNLTTMTLDVIDRGLTELSGSQRIARSLNTAMHEIDEGFDWPYLRTQVSGAAPLTVPTFRRILSVVDTINDNTLTFMDERTLLDYFGDLTAPGMAMYYYLVDSAGVTTMNTFPVAAGGAFLVDYLKVSADLSAALDAPLMPDRFREAIVQYAVADLSPDPNVSAIARARGDAIVARMRDSLLTRNGAPEQQVILDGSTDW